MKTYGLFLILLLFKNLTAQEEPYMIWEYEYGDEQNHQMGNNTLQTSDNGYLVSFIEDDLEGDSGSNYGLAKLLAEGQQEWIKTFGGSETDTPVKIFKTDSGNFLLLGHSRSNNGDVSNNHGDFDIWILKIDESGTILWEKNYGGSQSDNAIDIAEDPEGGFVVLGASSSSDGDITENNGSLDYWLFKISENGDLIWGKTYGGSSYDWPHNLVRTIDGGWLVSGTSTSQNGDISNPLGGLDIWIIKVDSEGNLLWDKSFGDDADNWNSGMIADYTESGGYLLFWRTDYYTDDEIIGSLIKVNDDGNEVWQSDSEKLILNLTLGNYPNYIINSLENSGIGGDNPVSLVLIEETNSSWEPLWSYEIGYYGWWEPSYSIFGLMRNNDDQLIITGTKGSDYFSKVWVGLISPGQMSTAELTNHSLSFYPNSATDFIYLNSVEPVEKVQIFNTMGKLVLQKEFNSQTDLNIDVRKLTPGTYFVSVKTSKAIKTLPLLVR